MFAPALRPLNELEQRLYYEKIGKINAMLDQAQITMDDAPTKAVIAESNRVAKLFDAIDFVPTGIGPMAEISDDIVDATFPPEFMDAVNADIAQARRAMGMN